jgi:multidrug efflux pump subunit AcrB
MWLVILAMRRPFTIVVAVLAVALCSILALRRMQVDIFPSLGAPAIYVVQPYGGMDPSQMESYITYNYEYYFSYIPGMEHVESKTVQGAAVMKLVFHMGADMPEAMAEIVNVTNRARANMPVGTVPPFIVRYDAGNVPVAQLVFSSPSRNAAEMQDLAVTRVRPLLAGLPGVYVPPPFGASERSLVVRLDPARMRAYRISPEEAILAIDRATYVLPSGNVRIGDLTRIVSTNAVVGSFDELMDAPVKLGPGAPVRVRNIGMVENGTDIIAGYVHVNGRRTVYIPVTKRSDASTLAVINEVKAALPSMKAAVPKDVDIRVEFDQSSYVSGAIESLIGEGLTGALLTGLMVLLFLRDWRSALVVITTIPAALLAALVWLWASGQTVNIMTLGGLALAVGVLVDEATVEIENIHTHMASGLSRANAVLAACSKTAVPRFLSMLAILSVFVPAFFMVGAGRQLFVPLSLAVGFAMVSSYMLSTSLVPVLATWTMKRGHESDERRSLFGRLRSFYSRCLRTVLRFRWAIVTVYVVTCAGILMWSLPKLGTEIFPSVDSGQYQIRLRAPAGTRIERTEVIALKALDLIKQIEGPDKVLITSDVVGAHPNRNPFNYVYLWMGGPQEAVVRVALRADAPRRGDDFKECFRSELRKAFPQVACSFEAGDIISQVMSFGSLTPVEVAVRGSDLTADRAHAREIRRELAKLACLRDLQYSEALDYPTVDVKIDRDRARQFGLATTDVARSLVAATSSSRFIEPNFWRDPASGNSYQIQIEIPQYKMASIQDLAGVPVMAGNSDAQPGGPLLEDVAKLSYGTAMGEVDRYNIQRSVSLTANVAGKALGQAAEEIRKAIDRAGTPPRGVTVDLRGQIPALEETFSGLRTGLLISIVVIFLLLIANFQSFRLAFAVVSTIPAVLCGVLLMLLLTGTTLNVQSFMGSIMSVGIAVANAILLVTFAEMSQREGSPVVEAAVEGARGRLRAILMTASAMIAGMVPIAFGIGTASEQTAPLGKAVIGGLVFATTATLTVLPSVYAVVQKRTGRHSASLYPKDPMSRYYETDS